MLVLSRKSLEAVVVGGTDGFERRGRIHCVVIPAGLFLTAFGHQR